MTCKFVLISRIPSFLGTFQKAAEISAGAIEIIKWIGGIEAKDDKQILTELSACGDVDWVIIDPIVYHKGITDRTGLIGQIRHRFPQTRILAISINADDELSLCEKGATLYRAYENITPDDINSIASSLIPHPSLPQLEFTHLALWPKECQIELTGQIKPLEPQLVSIKSYPAMRLVYFLAFERYRAGHGWLKLIQRRVGHRVEREYHCLQPAVWEALEKVFERKPRKHSDPDLVDCDLLRKLESLIDQPTTKGAASIIIDRYDLSQRTSFANKDVTDSLSSYQCEKLILGPHQGKSTYMLHESIPAQHIRFNLDC